MKTHTIALSLSLLLGAALAPGAMAQSAPQPTLITEQEVQAIGVDAYLYFYSLVTMDLTRKQLANVEPGKGLGGPMNMFQNIPTFPSADMRVVVRPNFDTHYSSAWLDLTKEPVVVSAPDTGGRYYLLPILDMWTDVFASPGWRTTGTQAGNFLFAVSSWMPFKYNGDGSLDLYFQSENPGKDKEANWLPAPKGGFNLTMRLYSPKSDALTGRWNPPPIVRTQGTVGLSAQ